MQTYFLTIHSINPGEVISSSSNTSGELNPQNQVVLEASSPGNNTIIPTARQSDLIYSNIGHIEDAGSDNTAQVFRKLPTKTIPSVQQMGSSSARGLEGSHPAQTSPIINLISSDHIVPRTVLAGASVQDNETRSLRSVSSVQTFESAISVQESIDPALQVRAIYDVLHSFQTALKVLATLIETRLRKKERDIHAAAKNLEDSLTKGEKKISELHDRHCTWQGLDYATGFTAARRSFL
jgi:hypothetical protein